VKRLVPIAVLLAVAALAGCGGKSKTAKPASPGPAKTSQTIQVKETEFHLAPAKITVSSPGSVSFDATNAGKIDHALEIEGNGVEQKTGTISPGSSGKLEVTLSKKGTYELYCPIDNHRAMGMQATVVVGGASAGGGGTTTTTETKTTTSGGYGY
jgi:plastocyanin